MICKAVSSRLAGMLCCLAILACPTLAQQALSPQQIDPLLTQMKSASPATRAAAVQKLQPFAANERVILAMLAACQDLAPAVRKYAANNLGAAGDPRGVEPLCALLQDGNANIRIAAIQALASIGDERAVPSLLALLKQDNGDDIFSVMQALRMIGGEEAAQALLAMARDPENPLRGLAIDELGFMHNERLMEIILPDLQAGTSPELGTEIVAAGRLGDPRFVAPLLTLLARPDAGIDRGSICTALGEIGDARAIDALCQVLRDAAPNVQGREVADSAGGALSADQWKRVVAATALGRIGDARAIPVLTAVLAGKDPASLAAVTALGRMRDPAVIPALLPLLKTQDDRLHFTALMALGDTRSPQAYDALASEAKNAEGPLLRPAALYALAQIPDARAVPQVIAGLRAIDHAMTDWSFEDMGRALLRNPETGPDQLLPALDIGFLQGVQGEIAARLLHADDPNVRQAALKELAGDPFRDFDPPMLQALKAYQDEVFTQLCAMLAASEDMEKGPYVRLLGQLGDARAIPVIRALADDFWTQEEALQALGEMNDRASLPKLLAAAKRTQDVRFCAAALRGLGALGDHSARDVVWAAYQQQPTDGNAEMRFAALAAAAQLGDPRALEPALALFRSDDYQTQQAALLALSYLPDNPRIAVALATGIGRLNFFSKDSPAPLIAVLSRYHTPALEQALIHQLNTCESFFDVAYLARVLPSIFAARKDTQAVPALISSLYRQERDTIARVEVVQALGRIGDPRGILPCMHALRDAQPEVVDAAAHALNMLTDQHFGANHAKWVTWWLAQPDHSE